MKDKIGLVEFVKNYLGAEFELTPHQKMIVEDLAKLPQERSRVIHYNGRNHGRKHFQEKLNEAVRQYIKESDGKTK